MDGPTRRLRFVPTATVVRLRLASVSPGDELTTFHRFFRRAYATLGDGRPILGDLAGRWVIRDLITRLRQDGRLTSLAAAAERPGLQRTLIDLLLDLKRRGVQPAHFDAIGQPGDATLQDIRALYTAYRECVRDPADIEWQVLRGLADGAALPVWLAGVNEARVEGIDLLTASQRRLLEVLIRRGWHVSFAWPLPESAIRRLPLLHEQDVWLTDLGWWGDSEVQVSYLDEPPARSASSLDHARMQWLGEGRPIAAPDRSIRLLEAPGPLAEADAVIRAIRRDLEDDSEPSPERIGIVVRDMGTYRPLLVERAARLGVPLELRRGLTLATTPLYRYIRALLGLPRTDYDARALLAVAQSNYCPLAGAGGAGLDPGYLERQLAEWRYLDERRTPFRAQLKRYAARLNLEPNDSPDRLRERQARAARSALALGRFLRPIRQLSAGPIGGARLHDFLSQQINMAGDEALLARARYVLGTVHEMIEEIGRAAKELYSDERLPLAKWVEALDELAAEATVPLGDDTAGVAIVSVQDLRGRSFRCLYVVGMQESGFPCRPPGDPLLRDWARERLSGCLAAEGLPPLPDPAWWAALERVHFARVLWAAQERLTASVPVTPETLDDHVPGEFYADLADLFQPERGRPTTVPVSRLSLREVVPPLDACRDLDELHTRLALTLCVPPGRLADTYSDRVNVGERVEKERALALGLYRLIRERDARRMTGWLHAASVDRARREALAAARPGPYNGKFGSEVAEGIRARFIDPAGALEVRGSELETFGQCPFRFLAGRVAKLDPLLQIGDGVLAPDRGTLVHRVLERFARRCDGSIDPAKHAEVLRDLAEEEIDRYARAGLFGAEELRAKEHVALKNLLQRFLEVEAQEAAAEGWRPVLIEYSIDTTVQAVVAVDPSAPTVELRFRVKGRMDRVDVSFNGRRPRIVDYKDSRRKHRDEDFQLGVLLQIALYAFALEQENADRLRAAGWPADVLLTGMTGTYYSLRCRTQEVVQPLGLFQNAGWRDQVLRHLTRYAAAFQKGEFPVYPTDGACRWCSYPGLCRVTDGTQRRSG